jgi:hypothetical protein
MMKTKLLAAVFGAALSCGVALAGDAKPNLAYF